MSDRIAEIRRMVAEDNGELTDWVYACHDLLAEIDRLKALGDALARESGTVLI